MAEQRTFHIALRGFAPIDIQALQRICDLSASRPRRYEIIEGIGQDIVMANAPAMHPSDLINSQVPVVWVDALPGANRPYLVQRPLLASRLLRVLDQITIKELHFIPEINIGVKSTHDRPGLAVDGNTQWAYEPEGKPSPRTGTGGNRYRVLVADDSQVVRTQLQLILDNLGIRADFARDGLEAIALMKRRRFDLILMDVVMPNLDGFAATKRIKKDFGEHGPIVMLTAKTSHLDRLRGAFAGCDTYLTKPLNQQDLVRVLERHLKLEQGEGFRSPLQIPQTGPAVS
ncbi:MAG: response regulator [Gammaproteobacteria bacterium]|nr:response regulator [Gammaproteobacteria bacterium]MBU1654855.1 response regulator [Gammaproteobacteria bacterium]MBU1961146.1 response regulator [Gammaproteobacteria bacterium]